MLDRLIIKALKNKGYRIAKVEKYEGRVTYNEKDKTYVVRYLFVFYNKLPELEYIEITIKGFPDSTEYIKIIASNANIVNTLFGMNKEYFEMYI